MPLSLGLALGVALLPQPTWAQEQIPATPGEGQGAANENEDINTLTQQGQEDEALPVLPEDAQPMIAGGCPVGSAYGEPINSSRFTPEEMGLFSRWDLNGDGTVSVEEQTECLEQVGTAIPPVPAAPAPGG